MCCWPTRRCRDPEIVRFLDDPDPRLVLEAARAINDVPIAAAMPRLAAVPIRATAPLPLLRRISCGLRLGGAEHAVALRPPPQRAELPPAARRWPWSCWPVGLTRPAATRSSGSGVRSRPGGRSRPPAAMAPRLEALLTAPVPRVQTAAIHAARDLSIKAAGGPLAALAADVKQPDSIRAMALEALDQLNDPGRALPASRALVLPGSRSRTAALKLLSKIDPAAAIAPLEDRFEHGSVLERQGAIAIVAAMPGEPARRLFADWLDRLIAGRASRRDPARPDRSRRHAVRARVSRQDQEV